MVRIGLKQRSLKGAQFFPENFKARKLISIQIPAPMHLYRNVGIIVFIWKISIVSDSVVERIDTEKVNSV